MLSQRPRDVNPQLLMFSWTLSSSRGLEDHLWTVTGSIMNVCGLYYSIVHQRSVIFFLSSSSSSSNLLSRSDRSIYLVATKLHNHFANYFLSSDCAQNHPPSIPVEGNQHRCVIHGKPIPSIPPDRISPPSIRLSSSV